MVFSIFFCHAAFTEKCFIQKFCFTCVLVSSRSTCTVETAMDFFNKTTSYVGIVKFPITQPTAHYQLSRKIKWLLEAFQVIFVYYRAVCFGECPFGRVHVPCQEWSIYSACVFGGACGVAA